MLDCTVWFYTGVVTSAAAAEGSVFLTTVLPYADLMAQKPPLYRDRESQLDMALPGYQLLLLITIINAIISILVLLRLAVEFIAEQCVGVLVLVSLLLAAVTAASTDVTHASTAKAHLAASSRNHMHFAQRTAAAVALEMLQ